MMQPITSDLVKGLMRERITVPPKHKTMGMTRRTMPQISGENRDKFLADMKKQKIGVAPDTVSPSELTATQGEFSHDKVQGIMDAIESGEMDPKKDPILISQDNKVMDGHHRWLACANLKRDIPTIRVNKTAEELLKIMRDHPLSDKKKLHEALVVLYNEEYELFEGSTCPVVTAAFLKKFEVFINRMFDKFGIDFEFTKHFRDRMSDERNDPCIDMQELANLIKKLYAEKAKGKNIFKTHKNAEAVVKDLQTDLNMPIAVEYDSKKDEMNVVAKTIMRKKNFRTPNPVIKV